MANQTNTARAGLGTRVNAVAASLSGAVRRTTAWLIPFIPAKIVQGLDQFLLPPGAQKLRLAVPAYWDLKPEFDPHWAGLKKAGSVVAITVVPDSWTDFAEVDNAWVINHARPALNALPGCVLGYVSTRENKTGPFRSDQRIFDDVHWGVAGWYKHFGQEIDGIYFDELVLPGDPASVPDAKRLVSVFRTAHSTAKLMVLAGQSFDQWVVGPGIDWTLMWETDLAAYRDNYYPEAWDPTEAKPLGQQIPEWWKDPTNKPKIVHVVHNCLEYERQHALDLAVERNAGNVFIMNERGLKNGQAELYNHLPPYWDAEVREVDSYFDFGLDPERALRAAGAYGLSQGALHGWPNGEMTWYGQGHVRGTYLLTGVLPGTSVAGVSKATVQLAPQQPKPFDISRVWAAAHAYARANGKETAIPTYQITGATYEVLLFDTALPWLEAKDIAKVKTYQQPTLAEPFTLLRNLHRAAVDLGAITALPTFVPDNPAKPSGVDTHYCCYLFWPGAPIIHRDVPTVEYIARL